MSLDLDINPNILDFKNMQFIENVNDNENENLSSQKYSINILSAFGGNTSGDIQQSVSFITKNNYILYNAGQNIIIREISLINNDKEKLTAITHLSKQNNIFILKLSQNCKSITSMEISSDKNIFILCENHEIDNKKLSIISLYYFKSLSLVNDKKIEPIRKIITDEYSNFISCNFSTEGDYICAICTENSSKKIKGIIYNLQVAKKFILNETRPVAVFDLKSNNNIIINKILYNQKIISTSGKNNIGFFYSYENKTREIQNNLPKNKNYIDHYCLKIDSEEKANSLFYITATSGNEIYIIESIQKSFDKSASISSINNSNINSSNLNYVDSLHKIEKFIILNYISNIFDTPLSLTTKIKLINQNSFFNGLIIGNKNGDLLLMQKIEITPGCNNSLKSNLDYKKIRIIHREIPSECTGITLNNDESLICVSFKNNEISYCDFKNSVTRLKDDNFNLKFNILCGGFHHSSITSMDIPIQRNIIVTASNKNCSFKIWNFFSGLSEYCTLVFSDIYFEVKKNQPHSLKNFNILALAIHPSGYYLAMTNEEMIWFFWICFKELQFYGTEVVKNKGEQNEKRINCHLLKFSGGGHILVAINKENKIFIINSYSRIIINTIDLSDIKGFINDFIFSNDDNFLYLISSYGSVFEINVIKGTILRIIEQKNINFVSCYFYTSEEIMNSKNIKYNNLILSGDDYINNKYALVQLSYSHPDKKKDLIEKKFSNLTYVTERVTCVLAILPEKHEEICIICGTNDGKIILIQNPINKANYKYDEIKAHNKKINKLIYIPDKHLLFSSSEDGNIYMYTIKETFGGETFYENQISHISQINTFLDVGLGDSVLFPVWKINEIEKKKGEKHITEEKIEAERQKMLENNELEIKEKINEIVTNSKNEISKMSKNIEELKVEIDKEKYDYIDNYEELTNKMYRKQGQEYYLYEEACEEYEKEIKELKKKIELTENEKEYKLNELEKDYRNKFYEMQYNYRQKHMKLKNDNFEISKKYENEKLYKDKLMNALDIQNDIEQKYILNENTIKNKDNKNHLNQLNKEIMSYKEQKENLELVSQEKEKKINDLRTKVNYLKGILDRIKINNNQISNEKQNLTEKISEIKDIIAEKNNIENFSGSFRKELYKRNQKLLNTYKNISNENKSQKDSNKTLEKNMISVNGKVLICESDKDKALIALDIFRQDNLDLSEKIDKCNRLFNDVIARVYRSFESKNKKEIIKCAYEIYRLFLTEEYQNTVKKGSLEKNLLSEFNVQIKTLEKKLHFNKSYIRTVKEKQARYKRDKIKENSALLLSCINSKKNNGHLMKDLLDLENLNKELKNKLLEINSDEGKNASRFSYKNISNSSKKLNKSSSVPDFLPAIRNTSKINNINFEYTTDSAIDNI